MSAGGKEVVKVNVEGDDIKIGWTSAEWAQWTEFQQSAELAAIITKAREKLEKSRKETSKGAGKGKGP